MKVLFVCVNNAVRSQMAAGFFNKYSKKNRGTSAGTDVVKKDYAGMPAGKTTTSVMMAKGANISRNKRKQLTMTMLRNADRIVVLMEKAEARKHLPRHFEEFKSKVAFWPMKDRDTENPARLLRIRIDQAKKIERRVRDLVRQIG